MLSHRTPRRYSVSSSTGVERHGFGVRRIRGALDGRRGQKNRFSCVRTIRAGTTPTGPLHPRRSRIRPVRPEREPWRGLWRRPNTPKRAAMGRLPPWMQAWEVGRNSISRRWGRTNHTELCPIRPPPCAAHFLPREPFSSERVIQAQCAIPYPCYTCHKLVVGFKQRNNGGQTVTGLGFIVLMGSTRGTAFFYCHSKRSWRGGFSNHSHPQRRVRIARQRLGVRRGSTAFPLDQRGDCGHLAVHGE